MADQKGYKHSRIQVKTPKGIARFPKLPPGKPDDYNGKESYKSGIVFDGDADTSKLTEAALKIAAEVWPKVAPGKINVLIKDGDDATNKEGEPIPELAGKTYMTVASGVKFPPQMVGPDRRPLTDGMEVRGGDEIVMVLSPMACDTPVKHTVTFRLLATQLVKKNSGGGDYSGLFDEEGEGFASARPDAQTSGGMDSGLDDNSLPF